MSILNYPDLPLHEVMRATARRYPSRTAIWYGTISDGFIRNNDATFGEKIFHVTKAHAEAMIPRQRS
jgi:hypothetical protein